MGVPELEAKRYEDRLERGAILLAMRCNSDVISYVKAILRRTGAFSRNPQFCPEPGPQNGAPIGWQSLVILAFDPAWWRIQVNIPGRRRSSRAAAALRFGL
jgi:hypothetical protein